MPVLMVSNLSVSVMLVALLVVSFQGLRLVLVVMVLVLMVLDLISLITMVVRMVQEYGTGADLCQMVEENPELLKKQLVLSYPRADISRLGKTLTIKQGNYSTSLVLTKQCVSARDTQTNALLQSWVAELQGK